MWSNVSFNYMPEGCNIISDLKQFAEEEKEPINIMVDMADQSRIEDILKNGLPDISVLTQDEIAENCKLIFTHFLPEIVKKSKILDKVGVDSFIEKLYPYFVKSMCNSCQLEIDQKLHNTEEKIQFALHKIVEMQANGKEVSNNISAAIPINTDKSVSDNILCVEYHIITKLDDFLAFRGSNDSAEDTPKTPDSDLIEKSAEKKNISFGTHKDQSSPLQDNDIVISFQFDYDNSSEVVDELDRNCSENTSDRMNLDEKESPNEVEDQLIELSFDGLFSDECWLNKISDSDESDCPINYSTDTSICESSDDVCFDSDLSTGHVDSSMKVGVAFAKIDVSESSSDESDSEGWDDCWSEDSSDIDMSCDDFDFGFTGGLTLCSLITVEPVDDEYATLLREVNKKWREHADNDWVDSTGTVVNFNEIIIINEWDDTEECRKSPWVEEGLNRMRFHRRIEEVDNEIGWIFGQEHRNIMFAKLKSK